MSTSTQFSLNEIAHRFNLSVRGNDKHVVNGIASIQSATNNQLSFLANPQYARYLDSTHAGAVILTPEQADNFNGNAIISNNPYVSYAKVAALFQTPLTSTPTIHPSASIDKTAIIGENVNIGPNVAVLSNCVIGDDSVISAGCVIGSHSSIGKGCLLHANVTLYDQVQLGNSVIIHSGAVIGADGFGLAFEDDHWIKVPQLGKVIIGDRCEIGANTTIDRGALEDTILDEDVRLDNLIQIAHGVKIGAHTAIAGCTGISGSTQIGNNCMIAGGVGIVGHITISDNVTVTGMSLVSSSIKNPGVYSSGTALSTNQQWRRNVARFRNLDQMHKKMVQLEKQIKELQKD